MNQPTKKPICNTPNKKPESKDPPMKPINNKHYPTKKPVHKPEAPKKKPISTPSKSSFNTNADEKPTTNHNHQNVQSAAGTTGAATSEAASGLGNEAYIGIAVGLLVFISLLLFAYFGIPRKHEENKKYLLN